MKKIIRGITSSKAMLVIMFLVNAAIFAVLALFVGTYVYSLFSLIGLFTIMIIMAKHNESASYKILWMFVVIAFPIFGVALYYQLKTSHTPRGQKKLYSKILHQTFKMVDQDLEVFDKLAKTDKNASNLSKYLQSTEKWPVYTNTSSTYFDDGRAFYDDMFDKIKKAEKFILLEYFIIEQGELWGQMFELLRNKTRQGVEVKLLFDDFGCIDRFKDKKYFKKLCNHGIEAVTFNKIKPTVNMFSQLRDHRKIVVIDGEFAYTGGLNIGDEYVNLVEKYGHWKDAGIKISGQAVWSFTAMFFVNWQIATKRLLDIRKYKVETPKLEKSKEYIQPFGSAPLSKLPTARDTYLKVINSARDYVYITTPYLVLDYEIFQALKLASMSGVDIKIFMPGIPDKKSIFYLSRSYYAELIKYGIKIYEYTGGFLHSKVLVTDDITALVSSINMDFRSLYLHFEAGVVVHNSKSIQNISNDFNHLIDSSQIITLGEIKKRSWYEKIVGRLLRFIAPLM